MAIYGNSGSGLDSSRAFRLVQKRVGEAGGEQVVDVQEMRTVAKRLRGWAQQIRHDAGLKGCPDRDAGLLDQSADQLEKSAAEIDRLRELISR